jgi:glycosyltransferase involved in cell wall biosynthesis
VGEITERIDDSVNGYIVPSADSAALLARMAVLAEDPNERARMGAEAFKKVSGLTPDVWADQFEGAIWQIASARRIETPRRM